ncbi:glutathione S-transferase family protein [Simiduia curdlanivorans]|uniref:Glutathione S-transferase family protein n=1 Tax=Simiduia curdlanivorans TaxID=1492769 RepID=A0ABV8V5N3_9GAMM|nr:glutathione S-transferase family protein [Simiduia curdlanivorans]MDN3638189.1 glutathione S-transferase family protein [Simiduia curdlanivorans]
MKLYGSNTSPYVRRLRIWLSDREFTYVNIDIFSSEGRSLLKKKNPTLKIPMFEDGDQVVFDSNVIYRYLEEKFSIPHLTWDQENQLTMINAASDSLIQLLLCDRSNLDTHADIMFFKLQRERLQELFEELDKQVANGLFNNWNYASISLYCLIDWAEFRKLYDLKAFSHINSFHQQHAARPEITATDPRV